MLTIAGMIQGYLAISFLTEGLHTGSCSGYNVPRQTTDQGQGAKGRKG